MLLTRTRLIILGGFAAVALIGFACAGTADNADDNLPADAPNAAEIAGFDRTEDSDSKLESGDSLAEDGVSEFAASTRAGGANSGLEPLPPAGGQLQGLFDRKIIQNSSIDVGVEDVSREFQEIIGFAELAGGFVSSSSFSNNDAEQFADLSIRVPTSEYQSVLVKIRGLGTVTQESSDANDITEEFTDLQARLRTLEATELRYLELLTQADSIEDILRVQDRLDGVRVQIEQVQGRINLLDQLTELATITIHLRPEAAAVVAVDEDGGIHPLESAADAWGYSIEALRAVAAGALIVAVFSWWIVPPLAIIALATRWWIGRRPRPTTEPIA